MFSINLKSRNYIYEQLIEQVEEGVLNGTLKADEQLPSVRAVSKELTVNPNTVSRAYMALEEKGIVYTLAGKGCFIRSDALKNIGDKMGDDLSGFYKEIENFCRGGIEKERLINIIESIYGGKESD